MNPWAKMASDLDTDDKIMAAGRNAREVFLYALRKNQLGDYDWTIPAGCMRPTILARILMMSEEEACNGVTAAVTEGLFEMTEAGDYRIAAGEKWGDAGRGNAMSNRERVAKHRERKRNASGNEPVTIGNVTVTPNVTVTTEEKRREEKRLDEKREEREPSPAARGSGVSPVPALSLVAQEPTPKAPRKAPSLPLPADWAPSPAHVALAHQLAVSVTVEADKLRDWAASKGERKVNWDSAFSNWLRRAGEARAGPGRGGGGRPPWQPTTAGSELPRLLEDIERMERES